jgi:hypothetical protein
MALVPLDGGHRHGREQAAGDEDNRVERSKAQVHLLPPRTELLRISGKVGPVEEEESAEEEHFGKKEEPHAKLGADIILVQWPAHGMPAPLKS